MEHRYLLTLEDLQERPSWAAALQVRLNRWVHPMWLKMKSWAREFAGVSTHAWLAVNQPAALIDLACACEHSKEQALPPV